jgi:hypothetical protein
MPCLSHLARKGRFWGAKIGRWEDLEVEHDLGKRFSEYVFETDEGIDWVVCKS